MQSLRSKRRPTAIFGKITEVLKSAINFRRCIMLILRSPLVLENNTGNGRNIPSEIIRTNRPFAQRREKAAIWKSDSHFRSIPERIISEPARTSQKAPYAYERHRLVASFVSA